VASIRWRRPASAPRNRPPWAYIRTELEALQFSGSSVVACGPAESAFILFLGTQIQTYLPAGGAHAEDWLGLANRPSGRYIVRPIAAGEMMVGKRLHAVQHAPRTLIAGLAKAIHEMSAGGCRPDRRMAATERYI